MDNDNKPLQLSVTIPAELKLKANARKVLELKFAEPSLTHAQIAERIGVHKSRVGQILNHPRVLAAMPWIAKHKISGMVPDAVERFGQLMKQTDNPEVARKVTERVLADKKVLDGPEITIKGTVELKTIVELQNMVKKAAETVDNVVDAEVVPPAE